MIKKLKLIINGDKWTVCYLTNDEFNRIFNIENAAMTVYNHDKGLRNIFFKPQHTELTTVIHELMHAYLSYEPLGLSGAKLKSKLIEHAEEVVCDAVANCLYKLARQSEEVYKFLNVKN